MRRIRIQRTPNQQSHQEAIIHLQTSSLTAGSSARRRHNGHGKGSSWSGQCGGRTLSSGHGLGGAWAWRAEGWETCVTRPGCQRHPRSRCSSGLREGGEETEWVRESGWWTDKVTYWMVANNRVVCLITVQREWLTDTVSEFMANWLIFWESDWKAVSEWLVKSQSVKGNNW